MEDRQRGESRQREPAQAGGNGRRQGRGAEPERTPGGEMQRTEGQDAQGQSPAQRPGRMPGRYRGGEAGLRDPFAMLNQMSREMDQLWDSFFGRGFAPLRRERGPRDEERGFATV